MKTRYWQTWFVALWIVLSMPSAAFAQAPKKASAAQAQAMIAKINQTAAQVKTLECRFDQVKTLSFLNDKLTSHGVMYYSGDNGRLRWEYQQPYSYVLVISNGQVHIKSKQEDSTIDLSQSRLFKGIADVMMESMTGRSLSQGKDFAVEMLTQGDDWIARLTPKQKEMKRLFSTISLCFDSKKQMVKRVVMTERSGDTTTITLLGVKTNQRIDEKVFAVR